MLDGEPSMLAISLRDSSPGSIWPSRIGSGVFPRVWTIGEQEPRRIAHVTTAIGRRADLNQYVLMANDLIISTPRPGPECLAVSLPWGWLPGDQGVGVINRTDG